MAFYRGPNVVTNGLVLCLDAANTLSYVSGSTSWFDLSGNSNTGTLTNGPTFNSGNGGSIVFDGSNDFITGSNSNNFAFGTGDFTVLYWAYVNSLSSIPTLVDLRTNTAGTGPGYSDFIGNGTSGTQLGKFSLYWGATRYTSTGSINTGSWYNIAVTRQSTTISVYFNGVLDGTSSDGTNLTENGFRIARNVNSTGTAYLNGRMAYVLVYKGKALTLGEVQQNYEATKTRFGL